MPLGEEFERSGAWLFRRRSYVPPLLLTGLVAAATQRPGRDDIPGLEPALVLAGMAVASLTNAVIVKRFGMRLIGHLALIFFTVMAGVHLLVASSGYESMTSFVLLQTLMMMGFSFTAGNFGAMAMENMGPVAGMANSIQGSIGNILGIIAGTLIGQSFDGTTVPLYVGYFLAGLVALAVVFVTEGGRFFVARNAPQSLE